MAQPLNKRRSAPLEIVERVIRNFVQSPEFHFIDTKSGRLYFALGVDPLNQYHGVWAFTRGPGVARDLHFAPNQPKALVIKELVEDGCAMLVEMEAKGLLLDGAFGRA